ncbi:hypothetical protein LXA43DRAFT_974334 [Ganoderma leucocontextum]|nr:hypothetical protein LXA43DRAFT_974334 [Ganoderma leucocontextum]
MSSECPGCAKLFSASGLSNHMAQTRKPECIAAHDAAHHSRHPVSSPSPPSLPDEFDMDADPIPFEGNYFGSYMDADFADHPSDSDSDPEDDDDLQAEDTIRKKNTFVVHFPLDTACAPILPEDCSSETIEHVTYEHYQQHLHDTAHNPYAPFASHRDWEVARWAKMRGSGSTAFLDLLAIEGREEIVVAGEAFEVFFRNILECIRALYGDPEFAPLLLLIPEKHYADSTKTERVYFDMHTGKWWWATQEELEKTKPGATVIPVIISSDKTQLTVFRNKSAYPVYMTLGNLPKDIHSKPSRRRQILLAYLPTTHLQHIKSKAARCRTLANLFHACMECITAPLVSAGLEGIEIASGDGIVRRGHPILAIYVGDYPEQVLVTGCKTGECPKCPIPHDEVGDNTDMSRPFRDLGKVLDALAAADDRPHTFMRAGHEAGIKPLHHPFWESLSYTNIYHAITPDILHQLYQGVMKHLIGWLQKACGTEEIDARCRRMPRNNSLRHFAKGILCMSRVSGKEHRDMCRVLPGLILGLPLSGGASPSRLLRATKTLLDFLYFAQYSTHHTGSLKILYKALRAFHINKQVFVNLGVRENFCLPKLHSLDHYRVTIEMFGTTDNYDTQYSECLHIDFTKEAYRASNCRDELPQMTQWLERREKILRHEKYIDCALQARAPGHPRNDTTSQRTRIQMTRHPSVKGVKFPQLVSTYGATFFWDTLSCYVMSTTSHNSQGTKLSNSEGLGLQDTNTQDTNTQDVVHVRTARKNKYSDTIPRHFDTVLVRVEDNHNVNRDGPRSIHDFQVAQVRLVFKILEKGMNTLFPRIPPSERPQHLAYVKWFSKFERFPHPDLGLYKVTRSLTDRRASIIPINRIERSCHLFPNFGPVAPREWTSSNVLGKCSTFYLNVYADQSTFMLVY